MLNRWPTIQGLARRPGRMGWWGVFVVLPAGLVWFVCPPSAWAQTTAPASFVRAELGAGDAATQQLIDQVMVTLLVGGRTVSGVLAVVPDAERRLRQSILDGQQASEPRRPVPGTVEIDVWLPTAKVTEILQAIGANYLPKAESSLLAVDASAGPTMTGTGRAWDAQPMADAPPGWRQCDARQMGLVKSAAAIDLRQNLLEHVAQWRLSAHQTVEAIWRQRPDFRLAFEQRLDGILWAEPILEPTGVCRLPAEIPRADIVARLVQAASACSQPIDADLSQAIDPDLQDPLVLDGFSVAPLLEPAGLPYPGSRRAGIAGE